MNISDYEFVNPAGPGGATALRTMASAHPFRAERLIAAIESFVAQDTDTADRLARSADGQREVYLVPPGFVLATVPDAAVLVLVDHAARCFSLALLVEEYGGYATAGQRAVLKTAAAQILS